MSLSTLIGFVLCMGLFLGSIVLTTDNYASFWSFSSIIMVFGGTLATAFISYQSRYVMLALKGIGSIFKAPSATRDSLNSEIKKLIEWAYVVQKEGLLALEGVVASSGNLHPLVAFGAQLVITGHRPDQIREMMETAVESYFERGTVPADILRSMASNAPAFGMIGTLVGLVVMLQSLGEDMGALGAGLAVALLTTLYGVVFAKMIFNPAASKIQQREEINRFRNILVGEGLIMLAEKQSPRFMQDRLNSFLDPAIHFDIDSQMGGAK